MTRTALWTRGRKVARAEAAKVFVPGMDRDDVEQEALIALWEAAGRWDGEGGASFETFAALVIGRRLADLLKGARRRKHAVLTEAVRQALDGDTLVDVTAVLPHLHQVVDRVESREETRALLAAIGRLPARQRYLVLGVSSGLGREEMRVSTLSEIDANLHRARMRLRKEMAA